MEFLVAIAGIIAGLAAIIDLANQLRHPDSKGVARIIINLALIAAIGGFAANFIYFAPKAAGDKFVNSWQNLDGDGILASVCANSPAYQELGGNTIVLDLSAILGAKAIIDDQTFRPINNEIEITYRLTSFMGSEDPRKLILHVKPDNLINFCVDKLEYFSNATEVTPSNDSTVQAVSSSAWNVYITNVRESPSDRRGWKNVMVDVVFESTSMNPYPLYYAKYISVLDSTGTWRERANLCCESVNNEAFRVPLGIRFMLTSEPFELPENATASEFKVQMCGSYDCSPQYAVFETTVTGTTSFNQFSFPFDTVPSNIPKLDDGNFTFSIPSTAQITFYPNSAIRGGSFGAKELAFDLGIENLTANDLGYSDIFADWTVTSVKDTGSITVTDNIVCYLQGESRWSIPPLYADRLQCSATISYGSEPTFSLAWVGFAKGGEYILQNIVSNALLANFPINSENASNIMPSTIISGVSGEMNFSSDGQYLITACNHEDSGRGGDCRYAFVWNVNTGELVHELSSTDSMKDVTRVITNSTQNLMATEGNLKVTVWNIGSGESMISIDQAILGAFSADGQLLAYTQRDNSAEYVKVRNLQSNSDSVIYQQAPGFNYLNLVVESFSPDNNFLALSDDYDDVYLLNVQTGQIATFEDIGHWYSDAFGDPVVKFTNDSNYMIVWDRNGQISLIDVNTQAVFGSLGGDFPHIMADSLLTYIYNGEMIYFNISQNSIVKRIPLQSGMRINSVIFNLDESLAIIATEDSDYNHYLEVWNTNTSQLMNLLPQVNTPTSKSRLLFSPTGSVFASMIQSNITFWGVQ